MKIEFDYYINEARQKALENLENNESYQELDTNCSLLEDKISKSLSPEMKQDFDNLMEDMIARFANFERELYKIGMQNGAQLAQFLFSDTTPLNTEGII